MLTRIDILSENSFYIPILGVTPKDSLLLYKVTGLNAADVNLFIGQYSRDGGYYQGRRVDKRNVVVTLELNPNFALGESVSGLRDMLYKAFLDPQTTADNLKILLRDDEGRVRYLTGYAEKFETDIFSADTMCQISLICPDPFIRDNEATVLTSSSGWVTVPFTYGGTAETGFEVEIHLTANTPTLTLSNNGRTMVLTNSFLTGDIVRINTNRGSRSIKLTRGGVTTSLLGKLSNTSPWLELHSQSNVLKVYGALPTNIIASVKKLEYTAAYWGV